MAGRHLGQEMAYWLKLLAKLAKQRGKHVWSRDKGGGGGGMGRNWPNRISCWQSVSWVNGRAG